MKTLEQLGISPTPWKHNIENKRDYKLFSVEAEDGSVMAYFDCCEEQFNLYEGFANSQLIAAAPDLYEALRMYQEVFEKIRKSAWFLDANFHEIMSLNKVMTAAEAALAKASGGSEDAK